MLRSDDAQAARGMRQRLHAFDWSSTPVGARVAWGQSLKTVVQVMLDSRYAMWLGRGPELTFFCNDAYAQMTLGPKHPWALGRSAREVWSEIWEDIGPRAESVLQTGTATWDAGLLLFPERNGFPEETYHTLKSLYSSSEKCATAELRSNLLTYRMRLAAESRARAALELAQICVLHQPARVHAARQRRQTPSSVVSDRQVPLNA